MYKHIILDFDGTIIDSIATMNDILTALSHKHNLKTNTIDLKNISLLQKVKMLRYFVKLKGDIDSIYREKLTEMDAFSGMLELMGELEDNGYTIAIITSNNSKNVKEFFKIKNLFPDIEITSAKSLFSKPETIRAYIHRHNIHSSDVLYIGDELRDIKSCKKARVDIAFVSWGLSGEHGKIVPQHIFRTPEELKDFLIPNKN